jgi:hypothetical protein
MGHSLTQSPSYARSTECDERLWPNPYQTGIWLATKKVIVLIPDRFYYHVFMVLYQVMDLARAPRRTVRKKGSGYENGGGGWSNRGTSQRSVDEIYLLTAPRVLNLFNTALQSQLKYIFRAHSRLPLHTTILANVAMVLDPWEQTMPHMFLITCLIFATFASCLPFQLQDQRPHYCSHNNPTKTARWPNSIDILWK